MSKYYIIFAVLFAVSLAVVAYTKMACWVCFRTGVCEHVVHHVGCVGYLISQVFSIVFSFLEQVLGMILQVIRIIECTITMLLSGIYQTIVACGHCCSVLPLCCIYLITSKICSCGKTTRCVSDGCVAVAIFIMLFLLYNGYILPQKTIRREVSSHKKELRQFIEQELQMSSTSEINQLETSSTSNDQEVSQRLKIKHADLPDDDLDLEMERPRPDHGERNPKLEETIHGRKKFRIKIKNRLKQLLKELITGNPAPSTHSDSDLEQQLEGRVKHFLKEILSKTRSRKRHSTYSAFISEAVSPKNKPTNRHNVTTPALLTEAFSAKNRHPVTPKLITDNFSVNMTMRLKISEVSAKEKHVTLPVSVKEGATTEIPKKEGTKMSGLSVKKKKPDGGADKTRYNMTVPAFIIEHGTKLEAVPNNYNELGKNMDNQFQTVTNTMMMSSNRASTRRLINRRFKSNMTKKSNFANKNKTGDGNDKNSHNIKVSTSAIYDLKSKNILLVHNDLEQKFKKLFKLFIKEIMATTPISTKHDDNSQVDIMLTHRNDCAIMSERKSYKEYDQTDKNRLIKTMSTTTNTTLKNRVDYLEEVVDDDKENVVRNFTFDTVKRIGVPSSKSMLHNNTTMKERKYVQQKIKNTSDQAVESAIKSPEKHEPLLLPTPTVTSNTDRQDVSKQTMQKEFNRSLEASEVNQTKPMLNTTQYPLKMNNETISGAVLQTCKPSLTRTASQTKVSESLIFGTLDRSSEPEEAKFVTTVLSGSVYYDADKYYKSKKDIDDGIDLKNVASESHVIKILRNATRTTKPTSKIQKGQETDSVSTSNSTIKPDTLIFDETETAHTEPKIVNDNHKTRYMSKQINIGERKINKYYNNPVIFGKKLEKADLTALDREKGLLPLKFSQGTTRDLNTAIIKTDNALQDEQYGYWVNMRQSGQRPPDAGASTQSGQRPPDAGAPTQSGQRPPDAGAPTQSGQRPPDAGAPTQSGQRPPDAGAPTPTHTRKYVYDVLDDINQRFDLYKKLPI